MQITNPIFVVGFPRSGTTFLQSLLATQAGVLSFPETHFYSILTGHLDFVKGLDQDEFEDMVARADRYLLLGDDVDDLMKLWNNEEKLSRKQLFEYILLILARRQKKDLNNTSTIIEKTPSHAYHMDKILQDYPDAHFIQIIRHPVDAISSYMRHLSQGRKDLGQVIREWIRSFECVESFRAAHPGRLMSVRYESLRRNMESEMATIGSFLSIEIDFESLQNYPEKAEELIMPYESWKSDNRDANFESGSHELSLKDRAAVQLLLKERMERQGYEIRNRLFQSVYNLKNKSSV